MTAKEQRLLVASAMLRQSAIDSATMRAASRAASPCPPTAPAKHLRRWTRTTPAPRHLNVTDSSRSWPESRPHNPHVTRSAGSEGKRFTR
eukprot:3231159-Rhodomonas_salina.1